jgi:hypothetical protein
MVRDDIVFGLSALTISNRFNSVGPKGQNTGEW